MKNITLMFQISDEDYERIQPVLHNTIDEDTPLGLRFKDLDHTPEYELAPQVVVSVLAVGEDDNA